MPGDSLKRFQIRINQNFGDDMLLFGYEFSDREINPGDVLTVSLFWQALQNNLPDYKIQLRLLDENGEVVSERESRPQDGQSDTSTWLRGMW